MVLFVNSTRLFDPTYQRYLLNYFREKLPFHDVPIKLYMRSRKQTDPGSRSSSDDREAADPDRIGISREERTVGAMAASSSDPSIRFINHEVNELLSDLDD